jgi:hypothetical protein
MSYGVDPIAIYEHALEISLFGRESRNPYNQAVSQDQVQSTFSVLYGLEKGGELLDLSFPSDVRVYHTQILEKGAHASAMGSDDWSWIGIVTGLRRDTETAISQLRIRTPQGEFPAYY